jgi:hypothetical protein
MVASSQAQPASVLPRLQLDWPSVEGCPSRDEVRRAIAHHLGDATGRTNTVAATAVIEHTTMYRLVLYTRAGTGVGTRELSGDGCRSVADAAVVILAMMLGADGVASTAEVHGDAAESMPQPGRVALHAIEQRPLPRTRVTVVPREFRFGTLPVLGSPRIGAGIWVPFGIIRATPLGLVANVETDLMAWRLVAHVGWVPEKRVGLDGNAARGARVTLVSAGVSAGPELKHGRWEFVPRIGISEQVLRGTGFGVDVPVPRSAYFAAARLGELLQLRLMSRIFVQSAVDVSVPLRRPALLLEPGGEVLRPAHLGLDASLLMVLRF